jgi:ATP-dependent exoDNAse (exonuclease V) alpha subunit
MAIYHLHLQIITRGEGKSAVAAAAYRSAEKLINDYDGEIHDYTRKGGVVHTEILLPDHAPREFAERSVLWNVVERAENQRNSQLARELNVALPYELTQEQNIALVREYVQRTFVAAGMCADIAIHDPDHEAPNPHAHIMLTMRPLNLDGTWGQKVRKVNGKRVYTTDWNDRDKAEVWRAAWADAVNAELAAHGHAERIDHRSYERQGVEQIPTVHLGVAVSQMERRGIVTDRGNINRDIEFSNSQIKQLRARINRVKVWVDEVKSNTLPTLEDTLMAILHNEDKSKIANLKLAAKTLNFITGNHIHDLPALADKVSAMHQSLNAAYERKKKIERRVKTLDEHLRHSENFKKHRGINAQYEKLRDESKAVEKSGGLFAKSKADKARVAAQDFYESHRAELGQFEAAEKYLKGVLQSRYDPKQIAAQAKKWAAERETCKQELGGINTECAVYKREVESSEAIKRFTVKLMLPDELTEQTRDKNMALEQPSRVSSR